MRTWLLRILGVSAAAAAAAGGIGLGYFYLARPVIAKPGDIKVPMTPERIARGKYIFQLADCDGCHSERDFTRFGGPVVENGRGRGMSMPPQLGFPGEVFSRNITPDPETGLGRWTDGEKIRAIREGISRDGTPLFAFMPYETFRNMSDEDVYSLVAYLNTLEPIRNRVPRSRLNFPVSMLMRGAPRPSRNVSPPDRANPVEYGRYLTHLAHCHDCHTRMEKGKKVPGMLLAGGEVFHFPFATVVSANITPDPATGIGKWSRQDFLDRFYQYREYVAKGSPVVGPEGFTLMPWLNFCQLPEQDLQAIYAFLRTQRPVYNPVETHPIELYSRGITPSSAVRPD